VTHGESGEKGERRQGLGYRNGPEHGAFFSVSSIGGAAVVTMATQQLRAPCSGVDSRRRVLVRCKGGRETEELPAGTNPCSGRWSPGIRGRTAAAASWTTSACRRELTGPDQPLTHPGTRPPDAGQRCSSQGTPCLAPSHPSSISIELP
jgi:hypothetical protein